MDPLGIGIELEHRYYGAMNLHHKARLLLTIITLSFFSISPLLADEPPWFPEFEVKSQNGRFCAKVNKETDGDSGTGWRLTVFELVETKAGVDSIETWSCSYRYSGYPGALVSSDGRTVVYLETWYYEDRSVIDFYRDGKLIKQVKGADVEFDRSKMETTASHELWLAPGEEAKFDDRGRLVLRTIDGASKRYDTKTGKAIRSK